MTARRYVKDEHAYLPEWVRTYGPDEGLRLYTRRGKTLTLQATAADAESIGVALVTLYGEHQWDEGDRVGILDGTTGNWVINPWVSGDRP